MDTNDTSPLAFEGTGSIIMSFKCFLQTVPAWLCERQLFRPHGLWRHSSMEFSSPVHFTSSSQNFPVIPRPKAWRLVKNKYIHFNTRFRFPLYLVSRCVNNRTLYPTSKLSLVAITLNKTSWGYLKIPGTPNDNIVQNHLNIALLNVF